MQTCRLGERQVFTSIHGCFRASWMVSRFLPDREHVFTSPPVLCVCLLSPLVLLQQLADEPLGQLAGVAEELLVKLVVYGGDVPQGVVFGLPQEGRGPAQPGSRRTLAFFRANRLLVREPEQDVWICSLCVHEQQLEPSAVKAASEPEGGSSGSPGRTEPPVSGWMEQLYVL